MQHLNQIVEKIKLPKNLDEFFRSDREHQVLVVGVAGVTFIAVIGATNYLFGTDPIGRTVELLGKFATQEKKRNIKVDDWIDTYNNLQDDTKSSKEGRDSAYATLVNAYYELATSFYEWGWGQSFHFAYQLKGETFQQSIARHEYYLAGRLGVSAGERVLDCGCGIGGPMRNIAKFTNARIDGVTLSDFQVIRGNELNRAAGLSHLAKSHQGDFMKLPFGAEEFDGAYAIEATCHAPKREDVYGEIYRVLKPGKFVAIYEWCLTPKYDPTNEYHQLIKKKIEEGDGLPDMATQDQVVQALKNVGFELVEARDMALDERYGGDPWWLPLYPSYNPLSFRFQMNPIGKFLTKNALFVLEKIGLVPSGTYKIQEMLQQGAWGCAYGGYTGVFTPMFLMVARKPTK